MDKITWKKIWYFIWEDNSIWSWIVNIILAFVLIKYVIFPLLGLILGSSFPVVAVVSNSMEHDGTFDEWWKSEALCDAFICTQEKYYEKIGITKEDFLEYKFKNGFNKGDVMVLTSAKNVKIGETIVYFSKDGRPIIHRVVGLDPLQTKGDRNEDQIDNKGLDERDIPEETIIGKASLRLPFLGYIKIAFVEMMSWVGVTVK